MMLQLMRQPFLRVLNIHKPHPSGDMKKYAMEKVRDFLNIIGVNP